MSTVQAARRSLRHFAIGRLLSALVGFATLLLLVRVLERADYGLYIALYAAFEILQLAASPGAYAVVFRFLPELRGVAFAPQLRTLVRQLLAYRALTLLAVAVPLAIWSGTVAAWLGAPAQGAAVRLFAAIIVFEGLARFVEAQFESLLEQGRSQTSALLRNAAKLAALLAVTDLGRAAVDLQHWLRLECLTTVLGGALTVAMMLRHLRHQGKAAAMAGPASTADLSMDRMRRFAIPTYFSQLVYMASGLELVKMLISRFAGPVAAAPFGFASALTGTLAKYLPTILLVGWLRPLFVSARQAGRPVEELQDMASAVVKLNMLVLAPVAAALAVSGPEIVLILGGGRMADATVYLYMLFAVLALQAMRSVISMVGFTYELGQASLRASLLSCVGVGVALAALDTWGVKAFCVGLLISETLWCIAMLHSLAAQGFPFRLGAVGVGKMLAAALLAALLVTGAVRWLPAAPGPWTMVAAAAVAALLCLGLSAVLRPFSPAERALVARILPARLFIW